MAKSIIQKDPDHCFLCGRARGCPEPLDKHHVFGGAYRSTSEKFGMTVFLCHGSCHIFGKNSVHLDSKIAGNLKQKAQNIAMRHYGWSTEEFIRLFGKSYMEVE